MSEDAKSQAKKIDSNDDNPQDACDIQESMQGFSEVRFNVSPTIPKILIKKMPEVRGVKRIRKQSDCNDGMEGRAKASKLKHKNSKHSKVNKNSQVWLLAKLKRNYNYSNDANLRL